MQSSTLNRARFTLLAIMSTSLSDRIKEVMDDLALNQPQLAALVGATKGAVNQWLSGLTQSMDAEYAFKLQHEHGYNAEWLLLGAGPKMLPKSYVQDKKAATVLTCMQDMTEADKDRLVKIGAAFAQPGGQKTAIN